MPEPKPKLKRGSQTMNRNGLKYELMNERHVP